MDDNKTLTLDLSEIKRQRVLIDGDEDRAILLDLSDMNVVTRMKSKYEELQKLSENAVNLLAEDKDSDKLFDDLKEIDTKMRESLDYIFDANVSEVCVPSGSMFDIVNGKIKYEIILEGLTSLYEENIKAEVKKMEKRLNNKHTQKYLK